MHIRFNRSLRGDYGRARPGDVKLVSREIGKSLVQRELAVEVEGPDEVEPAEDASSSQAKARKAKATPDAE